MLLPHMLFETQERRKTFRLLPPPTSFVRACIQLVAVIMVLKPVDGFTVIHQRLDIWEGWSIAAFEVAGCVCLVLVHLFS